MGRRESLRPDQPAAAAKAQEEAEGAKGAEPAAK